MCISGLYRCKNIHAVRAIKRGSLYKVTSTKFHRVRCRSNAPIASILAPYYLRAAINLPSTLARFDETLRSEATELFLNTAGAVFMAGE